MKVAILTAACVVMTAGFALANFGYGYGNGGYSGGYTYVPYMPPPFGRQGSGGFGNGGFMMMIGFLFLIMILFNSSLFNTTSSTSPTVNFVNSG